MRPIRFVSRRTQLIAANSSAAIVLLVGLAVGIGIARVLPRQGAIRRLEAVLRTNDKLLQRLTEAESGQRGFIIADDPSYLGPYRVAALDAQREASRLHDMIVDDSASQGELVTLDSLVPRRLNTLADVITVRAQAGLTSARTALAAGLGNALMDSIRTASAGVERRYANRLTDQLGAGAGETRILFVVLAGGSTLAAVVALFLTDLLGRAAAEQQGVSALLAATNVQLREQADDLLRHRDQLQERTIEAERLRNEAESANRAKSAFLAMMSHDLRTPLNAIGGYADLLDAGIGGELNDTQRGYVRRIVTSNRFLLGLINDVLILAKTESGQLDIRPERLKPADFLFSIEPMIAPQIAAGDLTYEVSRSCGVAECTACVLADREKLNQILLNLATNAIKYTTPGGAIELRCACDPNEVRLAVQDTGRGIPADKLEEIFQPFTQLESPVRGDSRRGVGLGLAISREFARRMGGDLTAVSTVGEGSTFTVCFPRESCASDASSGSTPRIALSRSDHEAVPD